MKQKAIFFSILMSLFLLSGSANAGIIQVPSQQPNIQAGINVAGTGDTVLVANGTYSGAGNTNLNFLGKAITVKSSGGAGGCVINCGNSSRAFHFSMLEGPTSVVDGFTIRNGFSGDKGGGIYCQSSTPTILNCIFDNNVCLGEGGAICCTQLLLFDMTITGCSFTNNSAAAGGGIYCSENTRAVTVNGGIFSANSAVSGGGIHCEDTETNISGPAFTGNQANMGAAVYIHDSPADVAACTLSQNIGTGVDSKGAGLYCTSSTPAISNCSITLNTADIGTAIYFYQCTQASTISDCTIMDNTANLYCGGIHCRQHTSPTIYGCTLMRNICLDTEEGGAAIYCKNMSSPTISSCMIISNTSERHGAGIFCDQYCEPDITNCTIMFNRAGLQGGGIYSNYFSAPTITYCDIASNYTEDATGTKGGGIYLEYNSSTSPLISNCTLTDNSVIGWDSQGGGIYMNNISPVISDCTFDNNSAAGQGGGIYCYALNDSSISNTIFTANSADKGGGIFVGFESILNITNATFNGNLSNRGGAAAIVRDSVLTTVNSIFWGNLSGQGSEFALYLNNPVLNISYSDVQGGSSGIYAESGTTVNWGSGMITTDPQFTLGPDGNYYLSQFASGQSIQSPCVDSGNLQAYSVCYQAAGGNVCMNQSTTRTDEATDSGIVDMGFHYYFTSFYTPTPSLYSPTPTRTPTITPTPGPQVPSMNTTGFLFLIGLTGCVLLLFGKNVKKSRLGAKN